MAMCMGHKILDIKTIIGKQVGRGRHCSLWDTFEIMIRNLFSKAWKKVGNRTRM